MNMHSPMPARLPPDVADLAKDFVGRGWALERIYNWLSADHGRLFVVTGKPGAGKTALASRLVQMARGEIGISITAQIPVLHAAHFCRWGFIESISPVQVLELISAQLANNIAGYAEAPGLLT
jgi:ABC-type dipeptide/oligopeptide/nickel transport system ATPase subunit